MSCIVNPAVVNPYVDNRIVQSLQVSLAELGWIENIYPMAERGERSNGDDGSTVVYPRILKQDCSDYIDVFPDDRQNSFSFFERRGNLDLDNIEEDMTYELGLIVWADLKKVDATKSHDFTDQLIVDVINKIKNTSISNGAIMSPITVEQDRTVVWDRYGYSYENYEYHAHPYTTFRVNFTVKDYKSIGCYDADIGTETTCVNLLAALSTDQLNTCILPAYDFADTSVQSNVTAGQQSDLSDWLCSSAQLYNSSNPYRTGQTTSYATNDDGDLERGNGASWTVLSHNNPFGNTNRFTDDLGTQIYADNIIIDWSTADYIGETVLGWWDTLIGGSTWASAMSAQPYSLGGYSWYIPNVNELNSIMKYEAAAPLTYAPFSFGSGDDWWSSTTAPNNTASCKFANVGGIGGSAKTSTRNRVLVRDFTFTELGV